MYLLSILKPGILFKLYVIYIWPDIYNQYLKCRYLCINQCNSKACVTLLRKWKKCKPVSRPEREREREATYFWHITLRKDFGIKFFINHDVNSPETFLLPPLMNKLCKTFQMALLSGQCSKYPVLEIKETGHPYFGCIVQTRLRSCTVQPFQPFERLDLALKTLTGWALHWRKVECGHCILLYKYKIVLTWW